MSECGVQRSFIRLCTGEMRAFFISCKRALVVETPVSVENKSKVKEKFGNAKNDVAES